MKDVLLVGFGIAGMCVAKELENRSKTFDIISDESQQSSRVAGGVLNPVVLKRYNLAWNAESFMPVAIEFYKQFNLEAEISVFDQIPVLKLFSSVEDQNNWIVASDKPKLSPFMNPKIITPEWSVEGDFKAAEVLQTHLLNVKDVLDKQVDNYSASHQFLAATFYHHQIEFKKNTLTYQGRTYRNVIFCEGFGVSSNPFFNWLPIYGNKGEYLIFKAKELKTNNSILKSRHFIIPMGDDIYKFGATYSRGSLNDTPTVDAHDALVKQLSKLLGCDFEVIDQMAGVRPTVRDRKPILGKHPEYDRLYILNGFGSRGVMAAPSLSKQLLDLIFESKPPEAEFRLDRFLKYYA